MHWSALVSTGQYWSALVGIGEKAKIRTRTPLDGRRNFLGKLQEVTESHVLIHVDNQDFEIPFEIIDRTRLVLD